MTIQNDYDNKNHDDDNDDDDDDDEEKKLLTKRIFWRADTQGIKTDGRLCAIPTTILLCSQLQLSDLEYSRFTLLPSYYAPPTSLADF